MEPKWVDSIEAKRAAKRGRKAAMLCSWRHWDQLAKASPFDVKGLDYYVLFSDRCALCCYYRKNRITHCGKCGLGCLVDGSVWKIALFEWKVVKDLLARDDTERSYSVWVEAWKGWVKAAESMRDRIASLYVKTYVARRKGAL